VLTVITASGGDYSTGPAKSMDLVEPYLRAVMNFMGVTDISAVKATADAGVSLSKEALSAHLAAALRSNSRGAGLSAQESRRRLKGILDWAHM